MGIKLYFITKKINANISDIAHFKTTNTEKVVCYCLSKLTSEHNMQITSIVKYDLPAGIRLSSLTKCLASNAVQSEPQVGLLILTFNWQD